VESVADTAVENVGVVVGTDLAARGIKGGGMLPKQLDLFLGSVSGLLDSLAALPGTLD
jgi:hypothetical protein